VLLLTECQVLYQGESSIEKNEMSILWYFCMRRCTSPRGESERVL